MSAPTALVTGAGRGLGAALVAELLDRGAPRVYAAVRRLPDGPPADPRVRHVLLDVTDPASVSAAAAVATEVELVVNNAAVTGTGSLLDGDPEGARREMETNFWGPVAVVRSFAPVLARNGGGTVANILSVLSWQAGAATGSYSATKAAAWSFTTSCRAELRAQGTRVLGVHLAYMDTDMVAHLDVAKLDPREVARRTLDAVDAGEDEVLVDRVAEAVKARLSGPVRRLEL